MIFKTIKAKPISFGNKRDYGKIEYIVVHYTGNKGDKAINNAKYYANGNTRNAGAHYFVDAGDTIYKSVPLERIAWSVGGSKYNNTKGAKLYGVCTNANSLSIEMCDSLTRNDKVEQNTICLIRFLMNKYGIKKDHVVRHFDVTGKQCPKTLCNDKDWKKFMSRI